MRKIWFADGPANYPAVVADDGIEFDNFPALKLLLLPNLALIIECS